MGPRAAWRLPGDVNSVQRDWMLGPKAYPTRQAHPAGQALGIVRCVQQGELGMQPSSHRQVRARPSAQLTGARNTPPASLAQQVRKLRTHAASRIFDTTTRIAGTVVPLALLGWWWFDHELARVSCLWLAGLALLVALAARSTRGHARRAAHSALNGRRVAAVVTLDIDPPEGPRSHGATVALVDGPTWRMALTPPDGWTPPSGAQPMQAAFVSGIDWPVLLVGEHGLLWPRARPRRSKPGDRPRAQA